MRTDHTSDATMDLVTLGEGQLRLTTGVGKSLVDEGSLDVFVAGTEANVAGLLSRLGRRVGMVTALPDVPLGRRVIEELRAAGIDLSRVIWRDEGRVALYFVEENVAPFPSKVYYDRAHSAFADLPSSDVDWDYVTSGRLMHLTGITPALTERTRELVETALDRASSAGRSVSFDVNFRRNLWSQREAAAWMDRVLTSKVSVLTCARRDAEQLFNMVGDADGVARALADRFGAPTVLVSDGSAAVHLYHQGVVYRRVPKTATVIDRVGAGDALVGGFLHGYLAGDPELGLAVGVTASTLAVTRRGEQLRTTDDEMRDLAWRDDNSDIDR